MPPKTSVYLSRAMQERVEASGKRVSELVELGLAISEAQQAAAGKPVTIDSSFGRVTPADCKHPQGRRDRKSGLCNACGTNVTP
jgi:hypothetical protein